MRWKGVFFVLIFSTGRFNSYHCYQLIKTQLKVNACENKNKCVLNIITLTVPFLNETQAFVVILQ